MFILKSESFMVVDGPYKGKKYEHGKEYVDIPPGEEKKFTEIKQPVLKRYIPPEEKKDGSDEDKPKKSGADSKKKEG